MPFRAKMKRAFGGTEDKEDSDPSASKKKAKKDYAPIVYQPGEPMPKPKYRGPWNQAHQDRLSAFSFSDAWNSRKRSQSTSKSAKRLSECSPRASAAPSRGPSRRGSAWSTFSLKGGKRKGVGSRQHSAQNVHLPLTNGQVEGCKEGEDDVMTVGLSRHHTHEEKPPPPPPKGEGLHLNGLQGGKRVSNGYVKQSSQLDPLDRQRTITNGPIFTPDELANAMHQSTLQPSRKETQ